MNPMKIHEAVLFSIICKIVATATTNIPPPLYFNSFFFENDKWNPIDLAGSSKVFTCVKKTDELGRHKIPLFIFFLLSLLF